MAAIKLSDKLMAKLILEEVMNNTLIEANGEITPINNLQVDGFDQVIHPTDLLEDYGWLGSWMHLSEVYASLISNRSKLFRESFQVSSDWLGGVEPVDKGLSEDQQPDIKVMSNSQDKEQYSSEAPISFIKIQLLLRLALLQSIKVTHDSKITFLRPSYQSSLISKSVASDPEASLSISRQDVITEMFFSKIREQMAPIISLDKDISPEKDS